MKGIDHVSSQQPTLHDPRIEAILKLITRLASGDLEARGLASDRNDNLDGIIVGLNMLAEELVASNRNLRQIQAELEKRVQERTADLEKANQALQIEVAERKQTEQVAREQRALAEALHDATAALSSTLDFDQVLDSILTNLDRVVAYDIACILLIEGEHAHFIKTHSRGKPEWSASLLGKRLQISEVPDLRRMMETQKPFVIPATKEYPGWLEFPETQWIHSNIGAPIRAHGRVIGFLSLDSATSGFFTECDTEPLQIFADQAGIAIENARLFEEMHQRASETQQLYELGARLNAKLDFQAVLQLVADAARELSRAVDVQVVVRFGADQPYYRGISVCEPAEISRVETVPLRPDDLTETIMRTGQPIIIPDMAANPQANSLNLARGVRSQIGIPIRVGDQIIGALFAHSDKANAFDQHDQELVSFLANQAGIAIENAHLFAESQASLVATTRLYKWSAQLLTTDTLEDTARLVTETAREGFGADASSIVLVDSRGNADFRYASSLSETAQPEAKLRPNGTATRATQTGKPVTVGEREALNPLIRAKGMQSLIALLLSAKRDHLGILYINYRYPRTFTDHEVKLLSLFANNSALALMNARLRETLRDQAIHDPLTGLFNRRYMEEMLHREIHRAVRHQIPLGIVMIDIDHFKEFNDTYGHPAGDEVLRKVAACLRGLVRAEDIICRYGGEEFLAILPDVSLADAIKRAEQIRTKIRAMQVRFQGQSLQVTVSIGVAAFPKHGRTAEAIVHAADAALYRSKQEGRDRVIVA